MSRAKLILTLFCASLCGQIYAEEIFFQKGAPRVELGNNALLSGIVKFSRDGRPYSAFQGIKYGNARKRFAASELVHPDWNGVKNASELGASCPQKLWDTKNYTGNEDCLFLNVYVPMNYKVEGGGDLLPVMVWVHGGGFFAGSSTEYIPTYFMDEDVIIVTINYRLGVFGFLSTGDDVVPGNNGLKDQVTSLKWVKQNIRKFGGNDKSVTIFGESAGSGSTHYLFLSPTTEGLFQKVISQSGTALCSWALMPNPRENAVKLATHLNCPTKATDVTHITSEEIISCLENLSSEDLNIAQDEFTSNWPRNILALHFAPVVEPKASGDSKNIPFMVESPLSLLTDKTRPLKEVPWLVGITEDEGSTVLAGIILVEDKLVEELNDNWDSVIPGAVQFDRYFCPKERAIVSEKMKKFYFGDKGVSSETRKGLTDIYSDNMFTYCTQKAVLETASRGTKNPVYLYQYAHLLKGLGVGMIPEEEANMVGHGADLFTQFDFSEAWDLGPEPVLKPGSPEEEFSKNFIRLWVSFAVHGHPNHSWGTDRDTKWTPVTKEEVDGVKQLKWFRLDSNPKFIVDPFSHRLPFWEQLFRDHFEPAIRKSDKDKDPNCES